MTTPLYVMHAPAKGHNLLVFQKFFKIFFCNPYNEPLDFFLIPFILWPLEQSAFFDKLELHSPVWIRVKNVL